LLLFRVFPPTCSGLSWARLEGLTAVKSLVQLLHDGRSCSGCPRRFMSRPGFSWFLNAFSPSCNVGESRSSNQRSGVAVVTAGKGNSNTSEEAVLDVSWTCQPHDQATCDGPSRLAPDQSLTDRFWSTPPTRRPCADAAEPRASVPAPYLSSRSTARSRDSLGPTERSWIQDLHPARRIIKPSVSRSMRTHIPWVRSSPGSEVLKAGETG
jgi:hypothetical protein